MNLTELRNKVKSITDYSPELASYNEQLDILINDAYMALWTEKRWKWATKTIFKDIWPDIVPLQPDGTTKNAAVINNRRRVTFSGALASLVSYPYEWEGQIIEIQGRDYFIDQVIAGNEIRLREPFRGTTKADDQTWKLKHRFYDMPDDLIELLYLGHRDTPSVGKLPPYGAVRGLMNRSEEDVNLREDYTSFFSEAYIPYSPSVIPTAEKLGYEATLVGGGTIPFGTYLEICWAFEYDGGKKVGPLSAPTIVQAGVNEGDLSLPSGIQLNFLTWDDLAVIAPAYVDSVDQVMNQFEGERKRIYFNQNFNRTTGQRLGGLPVWREITLGSTATVPGTPGLSTSEDPVRVLDTVGSYTLLHLNQVNPGNKRYIEWDGSHFRFRPYPRPIGSDFTYLFVQGTAIPEVNNATERLFRQWEMRYYRRPHYLGLQTDTPEMPVEFHGLIIYKVLHDIYSKHDNLSQAQNYKKKYDDEITRLEKRYVDSVDMNIIRGQFGVRGRLYTPFDPSSLRRLN